MLFKRSPKFFGLHAHPGRWLSVLLGLIPFVLYIGLYVYFSDMRLAENPKDKIMPAVSSMADSLYEYAFVPNKHGEYVLLNDAVNSLRRIIIGVSLSSIVGLFLGLNMALFPGLKALIYPITTFKGIIPPLALMPILLITAGTGEVAKIALIFVGTVVAITMAVYKETKSIPPEQITKALTLGATQLEVVYKIMLPQVMPALFVAIRHNLGWAWAYLIAGEAIASQDGMGYRIYLVKRYLAMDTIIPYVMIIAGLGFAMDFALKRFISWRYKWYVAAKGE